MADNSVLASVFKLHVNTGTSSTPTWTEVKGIKSLTWSPSQQTADTSTFSNAGYDSVTIVSRGLTVSADGIAQYDDVDGELVKDAGQAACEEYADALGRAARAEFLIHLPDGVNGIRFKGDVSVTKLGGSVTDVATWKVDVTTSEPAVVVELD